MLHAFKNFPSKNNLLLMLLGDVDKKISPAGKRDNLVGSRREQYFVLFCWPQHQQTVQQYFGISLLMKHNNLVCTSNTG